MPLTDSEAAELLSLQAARLKLNTGTLPDRVVFQGHETNFAKIDRPRLESRIGELEAKAASPTGRRRGGVHFRL